MDRISDDFCLIFLCPGMVSQRGACRTVIPRLFVPILLWLLVFSSMNEDIVVGILRMMTCTT